MSDLLLVMFLRLVGCTGVHGKAHGRRMETVGKHNAALGFLHVVYLRRAIKHCTCILHQKLHSTIYASVNNSSGCC